MRRRLVLAVLIVVAVASVGGYALARSGSVPMASSGWTSYAPLKTTSRTSTSPRVYSVPSVPVQVDEASCTGSSTGASYCEFVLTDGRRFKCSGSTGSKLARAVPSLSVLSHPRGASG
jgi:hypothetical protein